MANLVSIGGAKVDVDDPCALYQALYAAKLKILAGEHVEETEIRSPVSQRRIRLSAGSAANMAALDVELRGLASACELKTTGKRTRYAKSIRFVGNPPYGGGY
jgi:hypothetical protein